jgi:hypothetical protein
MALQLQTNEGQTAQWCWSFQILKFACRRRGHWEETGNDRSRDSTNNLLEKHLEYHQKATGVKRDLTWKSTTKPNSSETVIADTIAASHTHWHKEG